MTPAVRDSLARSSLKIGGTVALTVAIAAAIGDGALVVAAFSIVGTAAVMAGLGWSHVEHTNVGGTPITLRALAPGSIPADVAAKMKENQT